MSKQVILGGSSYAPSAYSTEYNVVMGCGDSWSSTEKNRYQVVPTAGNFSNLSIKLTAAPGAGKSRTFTIRKNGADTAITITISNTDTTGTYTNSVAFVAGDLIDIEHTPSGTPTSTDADWSIKFTPTVAGETILMGTSGIFSLNKTATEYGALHGGALDPEAAAVDMTTLFPTGGTLKKLYVNLDNDPGAGDSYTFTVYDIAGTSNTSITTTISDTDTTGSDIVYTESVTAGDTYCLKIEYNNSPATTNASWGIVFVPDTEGDFCFFSSDDTDILAGYTTYQYFNNAFKAWQTSESEAENYAPGILLRNMYVKLDAAPDTGKSRTFTVRDDSADTSLIVTISDLDTTGNDSTETLIVEGSYVSVKHEESNTPDPAKVFVGILAVVGDIDVSPSTQALALALKTPSVKIGAGFSSPVSELTLGLPVPTPASSYTAYVNTTEYSVELRDKDGNLKSYLQPWVSKLSWSWNRKGGCGRCKITLKKEYRFRDFSPLDDIRIRVKDLDNDVTKLVYRGWIASIRPKIAGGQDDTITLDVRGYFDLLKYIIVQDSGDEKTYSSQQVSATVDDIVDDFITGNTDITKGTINTSDFVADTLLFKESVASALQTCADLLGDVEYGVDENLVFFWYNESTDVTRKFFVGDNLASFQRTQNYNKLVNKIYFEGGDTGSGPLLRTATDSTSITNNFLAEKVVVNASINTTSVADQYLTALLNRDASVKTQYKIAINDTDFRMEDTLPLGKIAIYDTKHDLGAASAGIWGKVSPAGGSGYIWGRTATGGSEKIWGGGSGSFQDQIDSIQYTPSNTEGRFNIVISCGGSTDEIAGRLNQIEHKIDNIRQRDTQ